MPLLNYTTSVSVVRSLDAVRKMLVDSGAASILERYEDGVASGIEFNVETPLGWRTFSLPARIDRVEALLARQRLQPRFRTREHAERVAWRIVKDWLEVQLALIATEMVTLDEVMFPYMLANGRPIYDLYVDQQLALPAG